MTYVHGIILPRDIRHLPHHRVHRRVEPVVVLRRETEDAQRAAVVPLRLGAVCGTEQARDGELAALDPELRGLVDGLKDHEPAVGAGDEAEGVVGVLDGAGVGLEFAVEELVECFWTKTLVVARERK